MRGEGVAAAMGPLAVAINRRCLHQCEVRDIYAGMARGIDSKFCTSAGVPGDILGDHKGKVIVVSGRVNALVAKDKGEGRWKTIDQVKVRKLEVKSEKWGTHGASVYGETDGGTVFLASSSS